jgi:DNA helicase-2/ATP-dependent DNA helicase PcrA
MNIDSELNPEQLLAAKTLEGPLLIIAGAGSGKTRMITFRMAYMLSKGISQSSILALTFTNKAAREMEERVKKLTNKKLSNLTVSTFHALGVKILRDCIEKIGYKDNFSIYDQADQMDLIKQVLREQRIATDSVDLYELANIFSAVKTERKGWSEETSQYRSLYASYLEHLKVYNAVDFDDLIMLPIEIFTRFPEVLERYHERYRYIMVDEFQDTSLSQYKLMRLLGEKHRNLCVVGDDDQSIYSWRGANYQNIVNFERDFPERTEIKLEQNYRSTQNILTAANSLIAHNTNRKQKELWSGDVAGNVIEIFYPQDETREAEFIAETLRIDLVKERLSYDDIGILVRTNSLTTAIEAALLAANIPYRVSGGTSFFQRKEIKDIIAYLRVIANLDDDVNLLRIINTPRRGIGMRTLAYIRELAEKKQCSLYSAISAIRWAADSQIQDKAREVLSDFLTLIEVYREKLLTGKHMAETVRGLVDAVDYWGYLVAENQKARTRRNGSTRTSRSLPI